jgi:hypothetical protein
MEIIKIALADMVKINIMSEIPSWTISVNGESVQVYLGILAPQARRIDLRRETQGQAVRK